MGGWVDGWVNGWMGGWWMDGYEWKEGRTDGRMDGREGWMHEWIAEWTDECGWMGWGRDIWDGMGWDGMGWDGMGWDGMGWDGMVGWMEGWTVDGWMRTSVSAPRASSGLAGTQVMRETASDAGNAAGLLRVSLPPTRAPGCAGGDDAPKALDTQNKARAVGTESPGMRPFWAT